MLAQNTRSELTFFIPDTNNPSLEDFTQFSESFYNTFEHYLIEKVGVISQLGQPTDQPCLIIPPVETLIFDARNNNQNIYLWQLTQATSGARKIWQIKNTDDDIIGNFFEMDDQGRLVQSFIMDDQNTKQIFSRIIALVHDPRTKNYIQEKIDQKTQLEIALANFQLEKTIITDMPLPDTNSSSIKKIVVRLKDKEFDQEYQKRSKIIQSIGFSSLHPYQP